MQHGLGDLQPPDHPAGVLLHEPIGTVGQAHEVQRLANPLVSVSPRDVIQLGKHQEVLVTGQGAVGREQLRHVTDVATNIGRPAHDVEASDPRGAGGRRQQGRKHLDRRALARAIGAEKPEDFAALDG